MKVIVGVFCVALLSVGCQSQTLDVKLMDTELDDAIAFLRISDQRVKEIIHTQPGAYPDEFKTQKTRVLWRIATHRSRLLKDIADYHKLTEEAQIVIRGASTEHSERLYEKR